MPPVEKGLRYNEGKLQWSLVDLTSFEGMVRVLMFGAQKYSRENWKKGLNILEIMDSMLRHLSAMMRGELIDPETGLPHNSHLQCNTMFFDYMVRTGATYEEALQELNKKDEEKREQAKTSWDTFKGQPVGMDYARSVHEHYGNSEAGFNPKIVNGVYKPIAFVVDERQSRNSYYPSQESCQVACDALNVNTRVWSIQDGRIVTTTADKFEMELPGYTGYNSLTDALRAFEEMFAGIQLKSDKIWQVVPVPYLAGCHVPVAITREPDNRYRFSTFEKLENAVLHAIELNNQHKNQHGSKFAGHNA